MVRSGAPADRYALAGALGGLLVVALTLAPPAASAQALQRLTVTSFVLSADTLHPQLDRRFHLVITAHVRERVTELPNLELPLLDGLGVEGDERKVNAGGGGSDYVETLTVVPQRSGTLQIAPATLDAIDARDGKAKRYFSNALTLQVSGGMQQVRETGNAIGNWLAAAARAALWVFGLAAAAFVVVALVRRRPQPALVQALAPAVPVAPPPPPTRSTRALVADALLVLRAEPTRATAMRARLLLRHIVGAEEDETLDDVMRRADAFDPAFRQALPALERAAFTHDADLRPAIVAAIAALQRYVEVGNA